MERRKWRDGKKRKERENSRGRKGEDMGKEVEDRTPWQNPVYTLMYIGPDV